MVLDLETIGYFLFMEEQEQDQIRHGTTKQNEEEEDQEKD